LEKKEKKREKGKKGKESGHRVSARLLHWPSFHLDYLGGKKKGGGKEKGWEEKTTCSRSRDVHVRSSALIHRKKGEEKRGRSSLAFSLRGGKERKEEEKGPEIHSATSPVQDVFFHLLTLLRKKKGGGEEERKKV